MVGKIKPAEGIKVTVSVSPDMMKYLVKDYLKLLHNGSATDVEDYLSTSNDVDDMIQDAKDKLLESLEKAVDEYFKSDV